MTIDRHRAHPPLRGRGFRLDGAPEADLQPLDDGRFRVTGPDPMLLFDVPPDLRAPRGTYLRCEPRTGATVLPDAQLEIVGAEADASVPMRPHVFLGQSQLVDLRSGGGRLRLHVRRPVGTVILPAPLLLDPVPPLALLRHARRILSRRTGTSLLRKARTALDLLRSEGVRALLSRIDLIGHGIAHEQTPLGDPVRDYAAWSALYGANVRLQEADPAEAPALTVLLVAGPETPPGATEATRASLLEQGLPEQQIMLVRTGLPEGEASRLPKIPPGAEWICLATCEGWFDGAFLGVVAGALGDGEVDGFYFDSDRPAPDGSLRPDFKGSWDEHLALQQDYASPLVIRRDFLDASRLRRWQAAEHAILDVALAASRRGARFASVEEVLFHHSTPSESQTTDQLEERMALVRQHLRELGLAAEVAPRPELATLQVNYLPGRWPTVSAIIPTRDNLTTLPNALRSLLDRTDYPALEVVIVDNGSRKRKTISFLEEAERADARVRILGHDQPFNFSELINAGAAASSGELLLLLNDDVEVVEPGWLKTMAGHFVRPETGAVGAKLLFPNGTIQHAGVALGVGGSVAGHLYLGLPEDTPLNHHRAQLTRRVSAVTAACLLTRRDLFDDIGGLDHERLKVAYNDIDYCLEIGRRGMHVLYEPRAVLIHHESHSRGRDNSPEKRQRLISETEAFQEKWGSAVYEDPFFSGNHALFSPHFRYAHPPRRREGVGRFDGDQGRAAGHARG